MQSSARPYQDRASETDESLTVLRRCHVRVLSYAPSTLPIQAKCTCSGKQRPVHGKNRPFLLSASHTHGSALVLCAAIVERPCAQLGLPSGRTQHSRPSTRFAVFKLPVYSHPCIERYKLWLIARRCTLPTTAVCMMVLARCCRWTNRASSKARTSQVHRPAASSKFA